MREAGEPNTEAVSGMRYEPLCPSHRGQTWSHHSRFRATKRGTKGRPRQARGGETSAARWSIIEAGALSWELRPHDRSRCAEHGGCSCTWYGVRVPPGIVMVAPQTLLRKAEGGAKRRPRWGGWVRTNATNNTSIIEAGTPRRMPWPGW
jgi:hypothetical protein